MYMKKHKEMFSIMDRGEKTMYNKRRIIKEMKPARGAAELYTYFAGTDDSVFWILRWLTNLEDILL